MKMIRDLLQHPAILLKFVVSILYIFMGVMFLAVKEVIVGFTGPLAIFLGSVLVIYGVFRFYRAWSELKEISNEGKE